MMLRILAFQPHDGGSTRTIETQRATLTTERVPEDNATLKKARPQLASRAEAPAERVIREPANNLHTLNTSHNYDWYDLVTRLQIDGVTRMVAENACLESVTGNRWRLRIDGAHETLVNEEQISKVQNALVEHLGIDISLRMEIGFSELESPAARLARLKNERQAEAVLAMQSDSNVQALLKEFDAELNLDSIRPIDSGGKQ